MHPEKEKNIKKSWLTRLHVETAKEWKLTPEEFDRIRKDYAGLTQKELINKALPASGAELVGPNGEVAYIRNDSNYRERNKHTLVVEMPLSLQAAQKREALQQATNFFECLEIADQEAAPLGQDFRRITRKPYEETIVGMGDPGKGPLPKYRLRTIWYHKLKKPYGSGTSQRAVIERRDDWIGRRYKTLLSKYRRQYKCVRLCMMIQEELSRFPPDKLGYWSTEKRNPLALSVDNIRRIANTLPKTAR